MAYSPNLQRWMDYIEKDHSRETLAKMLHDDVVFHSPVVHTPQEGKDITMLYLNSAGEVLGGSDFEYVRIVEQGNHAILEFNQVIDGIKIDGIDMITWNDDGMIVEFKVMVRPLKAINKVHQQMGVMLEKLKAAS